MRKSFSKLTRPILLCKRTGFHSVQVLNGVQQIRCIGGAHAANEKSGEQYIIQGKVKVEPTPLNIWKQTREGVDKITGAFYQDIPTQVREALEGDSRPGSYRRQLSLSLVNFWQEYQMFIISLALVGIGYYTFTTFSETQLSESLSPYIVLCVGLGVISLVSVGRRRYYHLDPDTVFRIAMQRLHKHPGIQEVLGYPVIASQSKALVVTGGDIRMKGIYPFRRSKRVQMIFTLRGPQRRGIVSVEAKKQKGQYLMNLLALDVPSPCGGEERIYLSGTKQIYERGHIMNELRVPFIQTLFLRNEYDLEDDEDDLLKPSYSKSLVNAGQRTWGSVQLRLKKWYSWGVNLVTKQTKLEEQRTT